MTAWATGRAWRRFGPLGFLAIALIAAVADAGCLGHNSAPPPLVVPSAGAGLPALTAIPTRAGTPSTAYPLTVTRADGRRETVRSQPHNIAVLAPGLAEILYAFGAGAQVTVTSDDCDYPLAVETTRRVSPPSRAAPDLAGSSADLILSAGAPPAVLAALDRGAAPVVDLAPVASFNELLSEIQFLGDLAGHPAESQRLAAGMRARLDDVQRRIAAVQQGLAVRFSPTDPAGLPEITRNVVMLLKSQAAGPDDTTAVSITLTSASPGTATPTEPGSIPAVLLERPGPRLADGLVALARALYPGIVP